jgi:UDP-N-acetylmuramoylalanine--D-glutamate ligase
MQLNLVKNKFAVVGLGDTGISIINYLTMMDAQIVGVFDTRLNPPNLNKVAKFKVHLGPLNFNDFDAADVIVISPGVSIYDPAIVHAKSCGKIIIGDIELFALSAKHWNSKIIGITGSNGKTTVTTLTGKLCADFGYTTLVAGNIGTPVLDSYIEIIKSGNIPQVIVLELSSFQLETTYSLNLAAATVLNISEDHLDRYRDLLEYAYVKANIFNNCDMQVLNADDVLVKAMRRPKIKACWFGDNVASIQDDNNKFMLKANNIYIDQNKYLDCSQLNLLGKHNYFNVCAALAMVAAVGVDINSEKIKNTLLEFKPLEHRMEVVTKNNGIIYVEDSKATNVGAVIAGVSGLDEKVHLILGGDGKGQDFTPLKDLVQQKCASVAIIGKDKLALAQLLQDLPLNIQVFDTLQEAVKFCCQNAQSGDAVVLSPACASWDMFDNYKHRAKVFVECVYANIS